MEKVVVAPDVGDSVKKAEAEALARVSSPTNDPVGTNSSEIKPSEIKPSEIKPEAKSEPEGDQPESILANIVEAYATDGKLSEAHVETLKKFGLNETMIKNYVEGERAKQELAEIKFLEAYGGRKEFEKVAQWASKNYSEADLDAFNKVMESGDMNAMKIAMDNLFERYKRHNARPLSGYPSDTTIVPYRSMSELRADMEKPEYASDPSFRRQVEERLRVSKF